MLKQEKEWHLGSKLDHTLARNNDRPTWCGVIVVVWWCFCAGVFVLMFLCWCFCGGGVLVVVFLCWRFCAGVFVLVFLWWCFCAGVFCGGVSVVVFV